jgi:recombination protein RecT
MNMPDNASTAVVTRQANPLVQFKEQLEARARELRMALPSHISEGKFQRTIITAAQQNAGLLSASRQSLVLACMKAAQDGLLPDGREAALVPFKTSKKVNGEWVSVEEVAYIPMAFGIRKKVLQARDAEGKPVVSALQVGVVYRREVEEGHFLYEVGLTPPLRHRPMLDLTAEDTTDDKIVGAYSIAFMVEGPPSYEFMRRFEIDRVRESSQTGSTKDRFGKPRTPKGPWVEHFSEMAKKTVLRRHSKTLPQSGDLILETDDDEFDAGVSTAAVLSSANEADPVALEDHTDETPDHDPETGEVIEGDTDVTRDDASVDVHEAAEAEQQKPKAARAAGKKAQPEKTSDPNAPTSEPQERTLATEIGLDDEQTGTDELGITKHPGEAVAKRLLSEFADAQNVIDLDKLYRGSELDRASMPDEIHDAVENGYNRHRKRLGAPAVAPQLESAK